ncbi:hypothetical protein [Sulfurimonas sp. HSL3-7]|uniref:hypothetical protein n=1 Tax=Sulfonitrofixus jiaomeiensis TaxID=3131938 RepID=UPI0031F98BCD
MQRSITYPFYIKALSLFTLYLLYESLSTIYLFLPPLFGVLFFYFIRALDKQEISSLLLVASMLLLYEADKGYLLFSSLVYFTFVYKFILPKLQQMIKCKRCMLFIYVLFAYIGFWVFTLLLQQVLWMELPTLDWHVLWYIAFEFFVVTLL